MLLRTHLMFALLVYFILIYFLDVGNPILFLVFVLLGALFVDIDSKKSKAGRGFYLRPFQFFVKHRGAVHSLFVGLLVSLLIALVYVWAGVGFFAGYISHLIMDSFTYRGVSWFWPLSNRKIGFKFRSGGTIDDIVFVLLLLGNVFIVGKLLLDYLF